MREGDIESIRNKMRDEGRPLKSRIIKDKGADIHYDVDKSGRVKVREKVITSERTR